MRLARYDRSPEGPGFRVREVPHTGEVVSPDLKAAFLEIHQRLHASLMDRAERLLGREDGRDAVGETTLALWSQWAWLSPEKRTEQYVFGILHRCIRTRRKENRQLVSLDEVEPELEELAQRAYTGPGDGDPRADLIDAAIAAMPPRRREVFLLVREQGYSYAETAEVLGVSIGTVNTHMRLATEDLRAAFTRSGLQLPGARPPRLPSPKGGETND
ncbi:MAG: RNA polymerase sigma factor [Sorangiineae bacterium PRO1]|nr:RNA polymerase sigma factor [Sorangiineae bacterium PRO1]